MLEGLLQEREQLGARLVGSGSGHCGKWRGMRPAGAGPGGAVGASPDPGGCGKGLVSAR